MVKLVLWRHAKTIHQEGLADTERYLTSQGREDRDVSARYILTNHAPDIILCSTATRTRETLEALENRGTDAKIQYTEFLYHCYVEDILELAGGIDDSYQTLLIVGHNPGLEDFILNVSRNTQPHRAQVNYKFYPGDVAIIEWAQSNWGGIQFKDAVLTDIFSVKKKPNT